MLPKHAKQAEIEIYTTDVCPYCVAAKNLLTQKGVAWKETNVGRDMALREAMMKRADGRRTVPQIFIDGKGVGGFDDIRALDGKGELDKLLFPKGRE